MLAHCKGALQQQHRQGNVNSRRHIACYARLSRQNSGQVPQKGEPWRLQRRTTLLGLTPCACSLCGRSEWYDKYFAFNMAAGMAEYEETIRPIKQALLTDTLSRMLSSAQGNAASLQLLDAGVGTGPNFQYYADAMSTVPSGPPLQVTGIDLNSQMFSYAQEAAAQHGLSQRVQLQEGSLSRLPYEDGTFDAVVCTLVLCSVPNPKAAISEILRVLRPGGQALFIEHTIASDSKPLLRLKQRVLDPLQQLLADGCHLTRDTGALIMKAGFAQVEVKALEVGSYDLIAPHAVCSCVK